MTMMRTGLLVVGTMAAVLVGLPGQAHARQFMATAASCSDAPADQQSECRACVDTQTMLRTGIAKHWWPTQPAGDRCVTALRSMELVRANAGGRGSSSSVASSPSSPAAPAAPAAGENATVYTSSRCDRLFSGAQAAECRVCTANPRGRYHQYEAAGTRCRGSNNEVIAAGGAPAAPAGGGAPAAGADPRNDPREYSTVYTVTRCQRHIPGALQAECTRCVDTPRGAPVHRYHQFEPAGTRCRLSNNSVVQP